MISTRFQRLGFAGAAAFLMGITGPAIAQGYVGAGAGITTIDFCDGIGGPGVSCDDEDTGLKIFGGYKFTPNFAVEGAWIDLGEATASAGPLNASVEVDGFQVAAVGILPINPQWSVFGKVGAFMWDASVNSNIPGATGSDDGTDIMFGFGGMWNITPQFGLRAEWERFDVDSEDVDFLSVGIQLNF